MRIAPAIALIVALAALSSASPDVAHAAGCTQLTRVYYLKSADLHETITGHWSYDDGADHTAVVDTTQTGSLHLAAGKRPSVADWHRGHQYGWFEELQGGCRIPDFRQGGLYHAQAMSYTLHGAWNAGGQNGTCDNSATSDRLLRGTFTRRSLDWRVPTVGFRWDIPTASMPSCTFKAAGPEGDLVTRRLHDAYPFAERPKKQLTLTKRALLNKATVTLPIQVHASKTQGASHWEYDLTGTVLLQRFHGYS